MQVLRTHTHTQSAKDYILLHIICFPVSLHRIFIPLALFVYRAICKRKGVREGMLSSFIPFLLEYKILRGVVMGLVGVRGMCE